jgi:hypothetical protein
MYKWTTVYDLCHSHRGRERRQGDIWWRNGRWLAESTAWSKKWSQQRSTKNDKNAFCLPHCTTHASTSRTSTAYSVRNKSVPFPIGRRQVNRADIRTTAAHAATGTHERSPLQGNARTPLRTLDGTQPVICDAQTTPPPPQTGGANSAGHGGRRACIA